MSPAAQAFLDAFQVDHAATDFSRIKEIRAEISAAQTPAAERAVKRHALSMKTSDVDGVTCDHICSASGGVANGTLFYLFGGGFISGSPYCDLPIIGALAERCGVEVIAPRYRLAPENPAPAASEDCLVAWRAVAATVRGPLALAGESAGGNLSLLTAQHALAADIRLPDAIALLSPAVDLRTDPRLFEPTRNSDPTLVPGRVQEVAGAYAPGRNLEDPSVSPLFGPLEDLPPVMITTGTRDMLMPMSLRLERQLRRVGVNVECRVWEGMWHVFEYYDGYPEAEESLAEIAEFLSRHL